MNTKIVVDGRLRIFRNRPFAYLALILCLLAGTAPAAPDLAPVDFDIDAQGLSGALREYSRQSEIQVIYAPADVQELDSPGFRGSANPLEALSQLLEGTGLEFQRAGENIVSIAVATAESTGTVDAEPSDPEPRLLEEIIVTAARREQPLSELPMSVTVLSGDDLTGVQFADFSQVSNWLANVANPGGGFQRPTYSTRGLRGSIQGRAVDLLIDGATSSNEVIASNPALLDFERIEVIRGSQGTLYGQNSLAGTIKFVSVRPRYEVLEGDFATSMWATSSGDDSWRGSAVVNLPIGDQVAARLGASYEDHGGFIDTYSPMPDTLLPDELIEKNINYAERTAFRGALSWQASDRLELYLTARTQSLESPFPHVEQLLREPPGGDQLTPFDDYLITQSITEFERVPETEETIATLEAIYDFESITLTSETTYYENEFRGAFTQVATLPGGQEVTQDRSADQLQKNRSQEIRLTSRNAQRLEWVAGVYWREEDSTDTSAISDPASGFLNTQLESLDRSQVSLYGNISHKVTNRVALEAGLRWFREDLDRSIRTQLSFGGNELPPTTLSGSESFETTTPRLAIKFSVNDEAFLFAGVSRGFRGGTINLAEALPPELATADPDSNWSYEMGLKGRWLDGRLAGDVVLFYNDWDDIQARVVEIVEGQPVRLSVNGESAQSHGLEWQFSWIPIDPLSLSIAGHVADSELKSSVRGIPGVGPGEIREGNELAYVPRWSLAFKADWVRPIGLNREVYAGIHLMARDGSFSSLSNEPATKTPSYNQGNVTLGLRSGSWDVSAFASNAWNERGYTSQNPAFGFDQVGFGEVIMPRRVGLMVRYGF